MRIFLERPAARFGATENAWIECSILLAGNFSADDVPIGAYVHVTSFPRALRIRQSDFSHEDANAYQLVVVKVALETALISLVTVPYILV